MRPRCALPRVAWRTLANNRRLPEPSSWGSCCRKLDRMFPGFWLPVLQCSPAFSRGDMATAATANLEDEFNSTDKPAGPCVMVVFGAAGDLTKRKLIPALYNLAKEN